VSDTVTVVVLGALAATVVGLVGLLVLPVLRRRSVVAALVAVAVISVAAVLAGVLAAARMMFLSPHDFGVVVLVSVPAGLAGLVVAVSLGRQVVLGSRAVQEATRALGEGGLLTLPASSPNADLAALSAELVSTSERLAASREREQALESSRRELVAWVSHDLRTPLAGLRAMAEALEDGVADDPGRYHRQMRVEVDRLAGMVDDLFELSRIHSGTLRLSLEQVSLAELVSSTMAGADPLARARGVHLTANAVGGVPVRADSRELARALTNLVVNAIRHTPPTGRCRCSPTPRRRTTVVRTRSSPWRTGAGASRRTTWSGVFEVAWRGTHARTPGPDQGGGLGLAIVRGIVEAHDGTITVANIEGGCRFEVRLPLQVAG
jgi:signal transduction histidine kinase